ncbi:MAG TPA: ATP-binding protein [Solirubrobacteraceae bacterium]|nr:ATP-binding protein [Solirubrobacteraceae bacterium]
MTAAPPSAHSRFYPAVSRSVGDARNWAGEVAAGAGVAPDVVDSIRLAVSEAVTNAVLHAYGEEPGEVQLTLAVAEAEFWVLVADEGLGHQSTPSSPGLGWGLALIAEACQDFMITERSGGGTELRMGFPLAISQRAASVAAPRSRAPLAQARSGGRVARPRRR